MSAPAHRLIETNGIRLNIAEQGDGPLVLLCHGECRKAAQRHGIGDADPALDYLGVGSYWLRLLQAKAFDARCVLLRYEVVPRL